MANTSGCGSHYLLRQYYMFHCISGRRVSGRSTKSTSFIGGTLIKGLDTHRGGQHWECFCKPFPLETRIPLTDIDRSSSYPLAYSLVVLPISVTRWSHSHHHVPSAALFFANSMFYLSGAINVLLFLIIRPELLLFPRPKELDGQDMQLAPTPQGTDPAIMAQFQHNPEPTSAALEDGGFEDIATPSHVSSRRILEDI